MKSFYSPDGQVKFELKDGLVEIYYKDRVYELRPGECDLLLHKRGTSIEEFMAKKNKTSKPSSPPYANSWDYHTYVKSEDCDG